MRLCGRKNNIFRVSSKLYAYVYGTYTTVANSIFLSEYYYRQVRVSTLLLRKYLINRRVAWRHSAARRTELLSPGLCVEPGNKHFMYINSNLFYGRCQMYWFPWNISTGIDSRSKTISQKTPLNGQVATPVAMFWHNLILLSLDVLDVWRKFWKLRWKLVTR